MKGVYVRASSRLHMGFLNPAGEFGRKFCSMGVALQTPYVELEGERSGSEVVVQGQDSEYVTELVKIFGANYSVGGVRIFMKNGIPRHRGLGSGTQYSLAI